MLSSVLWNWELRQSSFVTSEFLLSNECRVLKDEGTNQELGSHVRIIVHPLALIHLIYKWQRLQFDFYYDLIYLLLTEYQKLLLGIFKFFC